MFLRPAFGRTLSSLPSSVLYSRFICPQCLLLLRQLQMQKSVFSTQIPNSSAAAAFAVSRSSRVVQLQWQQYFFPNGALNDAKLLLNKKKTDAAVRLFHKNRNNNNNSSTAILTNFSTQIPDVSKLQAASAASVEAPPGQDVLRHRRRRRRRQSGTLAAESEVIPPDASARLSNHAATLSKRSLSRAFATYLSLAKPRLSFLVVLTCSTAYSLYPVPELLLPSTTASPSLSSLTLLFLTTGTFLSAASANTFNMVLEPEYDARMSRTRNRPLVRKLVTPRAAVIFALATGTLGLAALYYGVNSTTAFLSAINIGLYTVVYTPLKRISVLNTWVGALVGGIPPLMGWTAAAGQSAMASGGWQELLFGPGSAGGWILAAFLFAWQFPHFNALSWTIREEYKQAGYRMLCWVNPAMNARVALRYSLSFFPICAGMWWVGVTDSGFLVTSSIVNAWLSKAAYRFWKLDGAKGSARGLFWVGVWQLPVVMVLAMIHKKGLWERVWRYLFEDEVDDYVWEEDPA